MLIVPFSHDQPDNAARMVRLGVARGRSDAQLLGLDSCRRAARLLGQPSLRRRAAAAADPDATGRRRGAAADTIEECWRGVGATVPTAPSASDRS